MEPVWIGIDIGTSSVKLVVIDERGRMLAHARRSIATARDGDRVEQDPREWLAATGACLAEVREVAPSPVAIGVVGHVPTLVVVDAQLSPVRPAIMWQDGRAVEQALMLKRVLGSSLPLIGIDLPWVPSQLPAMLAWLRRHEPASQRAARWVLSPKDYVVAQLTGVVTTDAWASKGLVTVPEGASATPVLEAIGWDPATVPPSHHPWEVVGHTRASAGLPPGTPVVAGWSDALAAMLAVGAFTDDRDFVLTGTSDIVGSSSSVATGDVPGLLRIPVEIAGREILYGPTSSGGGVIAWAAALLGCSVHELVELASAASPSTATFAPYLNGERAPLWDDRLRGLAAGLSLSDGRPEFARAVMRGVASTAASIFGRGTTPGKDDRHEVHVLGRGALDGAWASVRAEVWARRQLVHRDSHGSTLGAAMLAWAGSHEGDLHGAQRLAPPAISVEATGSDAVSHALLHERVTEMSSWWKVMTESEET